MKYLLYNIVCAFVFSTRKYIAIVSYEQRQSYKDDFNAEYDEYRNLHARMESITRKFMKLDEQRKQLSPGSKEYHVKKSKTMKTVSYFCLTSYRILHFQHRQVLQFSNPLNYVDMILKCPRETKQQDVC